MIRDVKEYHVKMQLDYNKAIKIAEKVNKEIEEGNVTEEQRENFENYLNSVKTNYDRVSYIVHLLLLPPKFIQKIQQKRLQKDFEKQMKEFMEKQATLEQISEENKEALEKAEELCKDFNSEGE